MHIVSSMEQIEKGFEGQNFSPLEKFVYIYEKLRTGIKFDPKNETKPSSEIRSLRGFITRETVCAGYAVMLKELLDRQGIECHYVSGSGHAWNIVSFDGKKYYPIDLTWDSNKYMGRRYKKF